MDPDPSDEFDGGYPEGVDADDLEFFRRYGPWKPLSLDEVRALFGATGLEWWIAGGTAAEAFHGVPRHHEDVDVGIFRRDLPAFVRTVSGRFHVWAAGSGMLSPLSEPDAAPHEGSDQAWIRAHALAPWRADVLLNPDRDGRWVSRRDPAFDAPLDEVTWTRDGVRYLNPEIVLSFKAKQLRPKDEHDLAAALPLLDDDRRRRLADYLDRCEPGHPWRSRL